MCNHYQAHLAAMRALEDWKSYIDERFEDQLGSVQTDVWPNRQALVCRIAGGRKTIEAMAWGVPLMLPGKRAGTTITKHVTNIRNLASPFWRSRLAKPEQRCLVPFSAFAEPKPNAGREEVWFGVNDTEVAAFAGLWVPETQGNVFAFLILLKNSLGLAVLISPESA